MQWCLHFDVLQGAPDGFALIGGQESERTQLPQSLAPNRLYLLDRAYPSYAHRERSADEAFPWSYLRAGKSNADLRRQYEDLLAQLAAPRPGLTFACPEPRA